MVLIMICFRYVTWTIFENVLAVTVDWISPSLFNLQGVHTIKKSYSLSDLSETDSTTDSFRQELIPVRHHRPRPKALTSGVSTRSTSLTKRPTSELYFQEVEFKEHARRSTGDYKWVRLFSLWRDAHKQVLIAVACFPLTTSVQVIHRQWIYRDQNFQGHHRTLHCAASDQQQRAIPWQFLQRCLVGVHLKSQKCNEPQNNQPQMAL